MKVALHNERLPLFWRYLCVLGMQLICMTFTLASERGDLKNGGPEASATSSLDDLKARPEITVTGRVTDETNAPLPGVNVLLKGTNNGTATDVNGAYTLTIPDDAANGTIIFSFIGYVTTEEPINGRSVIDVVLGTDVQNLNEVVVIGYQTVEKKDLTGAVSLVDPAASNRVTANSLAESIQGLAPGVTVRNGGGPGQMARIEIRGAASFTNTDPLYVIDGMIADANTTINNNDIESIQILKDASAAAIYGSRAANGVIIITTKKGKPGEPKVTASTRLSVSEIPKRYDMMNAQEYVITNSNAFQADNFPVQPAVANYDGSVDVNWADELLRTGVVQDHNASISGGSENSNYLISAGYFKDKGTLIARDFDRKSLRVNTETRRGKFKLGENLSITSSNYNRPEEGGAFAGNPFSDAMEAEVLAQHPVPPIQRDQLALGEVLGQGASGVIHGATWQAPRSDGNTRRASAASRFSVPRTAGYA